MKLVFLGIVSVMMTACAGGGGGYYPDYGYMQGQNANMERQMRYNQCIQENQRRQSMSNRVTVNSPCY